MRNNYISWDDYFMGIAHLSSQRSKDECTQVGACIVNPRNRIVGIGYNGLPFGCQDAQFPWNREGQWLETKYPYVVHAESNAILNSTGDLENCKLYVTLFPCHECAKLVIQSGIKEIIYQEDKYHDTESIIASRRMLDTAKVTYRLIPPISIHLKYETGETNE